MKSPPLMRKKTQALTAREKPKARAMYIRTVGFGLCGSDVESSPEVDLALLATCVPAKARKRKRNVPTNSEVLAMRWLRRPFGSLLKKGEGFGPCILSVNDKSVDALDFS